MWLYRAGYPAQVSHYPRFLLVSRADWSIRRPVRSPRPTGEPVERDVVKHLIPSERPLGKLPAFRNVVGKLIVGEDNPEQCQIANKILNSWMHVAGLRLNG